MEGEIECSECYVSNAYMFGYDVTQFYIWSLLCFKQLIFLLNDRLVDADIEGILSLLYGTLTSSVTVPPNLLLITISNVLIYIASNCPIRNLSNLQCTHRSWLVHRVVLPPLLSGFLKETAQCPLVIQQQLLIFLLYLLCHNSRGNELKQAIDAVIAPLFATLLTSSASSVESAPRRSASFRGNPFNASTSIVLNSQFTRSAYLVTAMLRVSYSMNIQVRSVIYPRLLPALSVVAQILCEVCCKSESASNYENCRILWNFVLYAAMVLRSHKDEYAQFLPMVGSLLQQLPGVLQRLAAQPKSRLCRSPSIRSSVVELHSLKLMRLILQLAMERGLDREFLQQVVALLSQVSEWILQSSNPDIPTLFVQCCQTVVSLSPL